MTTPDRVSAAAGTFAACVGALALAGWTLDIDVLKGVGGAITMKPNTALGLVACGLSLRTYVSSRQMLRWLSPVLAIFAGLIGILTLSQHVAGWTLGIDELLFVEAPGSPPTSFERFRQEDATTTRESAGSASVWRSRASWRRSTTVRCRYFQTAPARARRSSSNCRFWRNPP